MIRPLSMFGMAASGLVLLWYESLSKAERQRADSAAKEVVQELANFTIGQIPANYSDRLHQLFGYHN
jgi:hypothetical protein